MTRKRKGAQAQARSDAAKRGWVTRKKNAAIKKRKETIEKRLRKQSKELKRRMRIDLERMVFNVRTGIGVKPWLGGTGPGDPNDPWRKYRDAKDEASIKLPKSRYMRILEALQHALMLDDYGWNIVY